MKRLLYQLIVLLIFSTLFNAQCFAKELEKIKYKNIKEQARINCIEGIWTNKITKKSNFYFVKKISENYPYYTEFYNPDGEFLFSTESHYEFINNGKLYVYSNNDLNFYELVANEGNISRRILTEDEIIELFPKFKLIRLNDFSIGTNSLKVKKHRKNLKLIILNDINANLEAFEFNTNNAKIKKYPLKGFIEISKKGMIQFSPKNFEHNENHWYILLIR